MKISCRGARETSEEALDQVPTDTCWWIRSRSRGGDGEAWPGSDIAAGFPGGLGVGSQKEYKMIPGFGFRIKVLVQLQVCEEDKKLEPGVGQG